MHHPDDHQWYRQGCISVLPPLDLEFLNDKVTMRMMVVTGVSMSTLRQLQGTELMSKSSSLVCNALLRGRLGVLQDAIRLG